MIPPERSNWTPAHDEIAADVADSATAVGSLLARRVLVRTFWWLTHHFVARPLAIALPFRPAFRFSAWTLDRRNM